jgi:hypothetical protein
LRTVIMFDSIMLPYSLLFAVNMTETPSKVTGTGLQKGRVIPE